jgi:hypothetical protein
MKLRAYLTGIAAVIAFSGVPYTSAIASLVVQRKNVTRVYVRNDCREVVDLTLEYIPMGDARFRTTHYVFSPGENGYLVDTDNLYIYITAKSRESAKRWSRKQANVGNNPGKYTYRLTCS